MPHRTVKDPSPRGRVLGVLENSAPITSTDIADILNVHPSTVRSHLRKLVANGQVVEETSMARGRGRPRKTYQLSPPGPIDNLLTALVTALGDNEQERERRAAHAGRLWVEMSDVSSATPEHRDPLDAAAAVLTQLGFEIQSMSSVFGVHELRVCGCPLRTIAAGHPEVARGIQRGVVQQALDGASAELTGHYVVSSYPDPRFGDCDITIRLSPMTTGQES